MSRSTPWRRNCSDLVNWRQCEASNATIYILRETGPTGFLLKEDGDSKPYRAFLGDPHSCTCPQFKKDRDLCKHICWLLLKKFRIPQNNPISWQLGLVEREINDVLRGSVVQQQRQQQQQQKPRWMKNQEESTGKQMLQQREISEEDVCPICQDELLAKHMPVTFCKYGCGNSIHIKCMKIWAEHQVKTAMDSVIKCPICREDFGPIELLKQESRNADTTSTGARMDRHLGTECQSCHVSPIEGKCYRCCVCACFQLCQSCFNTPTHTHHDFEFRHKRNQRWKAAQRMFGAVLPQAVAESLLRRDLSESDYDLLTQLDSHNTGARSDIPESVIQRFPLIKIRDMSPLLAPGSQCRICLRAFEIGQFVRKLPICKHKFHKDCIDSWLLHSHPTCPIDGQVVWDPNTSEEDTDGQQINRPPGRLSNASSQLQLEIPGVGIVRQTNDNHNVPQKGSGRRLQGHMYQDPRLPNGSLRSSFTLSGTSVGVANEDPTSNTTILPGSRLLGRARARRLELRQQLMHDQADEVDQENLLPEEDSSQRDQNTPTQRAILNHLAHLQSPEEDSTSPSTRGQQNLLSRRLTKHSSATDLRSGFLGELSPLLEMEHETESLPAGVPSSREEHRGPLNTSVGSLQSRLFEKYGLPHMLGHRAPPAEVFAESEQRKTSSAPASIANGVPESQTNIADQVFPRSQGGTIHSAGMAAEERPQMSTGSKSASHVSRPGRTLNADSTLLSGIQHFADLYIGNNPETHSAVNAPVSNQTRLQPRRFGNNKGLPPHRKSKIRPQKQNFALEGNGIQSLTLRDLI